MNIIAFDSQIPEDQSPESVFHDLIFSHSAVSSSSLGVVWDLPKFVAQIMSKLPQPVQDSLAKPPHRAKFGSYKIYSVQGKIFSANLNGSEMNVYDLSQYYPGEREPETLSELQEKADLLQQALTDLGVPRPATLASPIAIFRGSVSSKMSTGGSVALASGVEQRGVLSSTTPTIFNASVPLDVFELALQCTPREWVSNYQIGHFPGLYSADLSSAYPANAAQLLHLDDLTFTESNILDLSAYYGFLVGDFTVYPNHPLAFCSPFITDQGDGTPINFVGTHRNYPCLLDEVRTLYRYDMGKFKLKHGWFGYPKKGVHPRQPLKETMEYFYSKRGNGTNLLSILKSYLLKRVMNGMIGKMLEIRKDNMGNIIEYGDMYNPVYHSLITGRTRLQVFDFLVQNNISKSSLVHVGVDGVKITKDLNLPKQVGMGKWRNAGCESAVVLSPGAIISESRNFKGIGYPEFVTQLYSKPQASKYGINGDIDLRNLFLTQTRKFDKLPRTGQDLLDNQYLSSPIEM